MRPFISFMRLERHHHFAKAGEVWDAAWKPSQPHPVRWQVCRADGSGKRKPWVWIFWFYPKDGSALSITVGWRRRYPAYV